MISNGQIVGDPTRRHQIIIDLCANAYQAMLQKGGNLKITFSDTELEADAAQPIQVPAGLYGTLTISNSGVGIPSQNIDRIFDPYFTTKEKGKGAGMGLAAVHGIVKSHGVKGFLMKPATMRALCATIRTVLDKKEN